jgi:hypothetical protein
MSDDQDQDGTTPPSTNGTKRGRGRDGRFVRGNPGGPGNPFAGKVAKLREAGWKAIKPAEIKAVYRKLLEMAMAGDVPAARLLLDRLLGPAVEVDLLERVEQLEAARDGRQENEPAEAT